MSTVKNGKDRLRKGNRRGPFQFYLSSAPSLLSHLIPRAFPVSPGDEVARSRARNNPSRTFPFRLFNSPVSNRPFYLACFVFPIQNTWCSPGNLPFVVSLIMHTHAYGRTCIRLHLKKKQFTGVQSRVLKWENKTYKLKRSIRRGRWKKAPKIFAQGQPRPKVKYSQVPEFEFITIDTVVHRSSSDWNLWIYLP